MKYNSDRFVLLQSVRRIRWHPTEGETLAMCYLGGLGLFVFGAIVLAVI